MGYPDIKALEMSFRDELGGGQSMRACFCLYGSEYSVELVEEGRRWCWEGFGVCVLEGCSTYA